MRKVLFISYFYPPCNLTASNRVYYWANYFTTHKIKVSVISRHWDTEIRTFSDLKSINKNGEIQTIEDDIDVFRLDEYHTLLKRFREFKLLRKLGVSRFLTFMDIFLTSIFPSFSEYRYFRKKAFNLISADPQNWIVIISGGPHQQFNIGYNLKRKFPQLKWVADYRDEWTSRPSFERKSIFLSIINRHFERKWLSNVEYFTYVNYVYITRIADLIGKKGEVIENGYNNPIKYDKIEKNPNELIFTFLGTLYKHQEILATSQLLRAFAKQKPNIYIKLNFIGIELQDNISIHVKKIFNWCDQLNISARLNRDELKPIIEITDIFVMFPIQKMDGVIPTKVYDYLPYKKPILFFPSDNGRIYDILKKTGLGISDTDEEIVLKMLNSFVDNGFILPVKPDYINEFSRDFFSNKLLNLVEEM